MWQISIAMTEIKISKISGGENNQIYSLKTRKEDRLKIKIY